MITEAQIQEQLFNYLTRQISLNEFEDWLVLNSWNMHRDSSDASQRLVGALELRFGEYSNGHLSDEALERELRGLIASNLTFLVDLNDAKPICPKWVGGSVSVSSFEVIPLQAL